MATSSIFTNVRITDPKKAEMFINALEESANAQIKKPVTSFTSIVADADEIRRIMAKRASRKMNR